MDYLNTYKRLLALADAGLFYGKDAFDQERYQELRELTLQRSDCLARLRKNLN